MDGRRAGPRPARFDFEELSGRPRQGFRRGLKSLPYIIVLHAGRPLGLDLEEGLQHALDADAVKVARASEFVPQPPGNRKAPRTALGPNQHRKPCRQLFVRADDFVDPRLAGHA